MAQCATGPLNTAGYLCWKLVKVNRRLARIDPTKVAVEGEEERCECFITSMFPSACHFILSINIWFACGQS